MRYQAEELVLIVEGWQCVVWYADDTRMYPPPTWVAQQVIPQVRECQTKKPTSGNDGYPTKGPTAGMYDKHFLRIFIIS